MPRESNRDVVEEMERTTKAFYRGEIYDSEEKEYNFPEERDPD